MVFVKGISVEDGEQIFEVSRCRRLPLRTVPHAIGRLYVPGSRGFTATVWGTFGGHAPVLRMAANYKYIQDDDWIEVHTFGPGNERWHTTTERAAFWEIVVPYLDGTIPPIGFGDDFIYRPRPEINTSYVGNSATDGGLNASATGFNASLVDSVRNASFVVDVASGLPDINCSYVGDRVNASTVDSPTEWLDGDGNVVDPDPNNNGISPDLKLSAQFV